MLNNGKRPLETLDGPPGNLFPLYLTWDAAMSLRKASSISFETPASASSPCSCFETWSRPRPLSPRPGAATSRSFGVRPADGPTRRGRCQQGTPGISKSEPQAPGGVSFGPRRRGRNFPFPTTGKPHPTVAPIPRCPVIRTQGANALGSVADGPLKSPYPHPIRSTAVKPNRLHPYPRAPTTLTGSAPQDRRMRIHQPHGTKLAQEKLT